MSALCSRKFCRTKAIYFLFCPRSYFHTSRLLRKTDLENNDPVKYSTSKAAVYSSRDTFASPIKSAPWYEQISVGLSIAVFLLYFGYLREENDIDKELDKTLYSRIPGLEESQIVHNIKYNKRQGMDTADLEKKLKEIKVKGG